VLKVLGEPGVATGFVGGQRGELIRKMLDEAGVAHDFVTVQPETRLCITLIDTGGDSHTELVEESAAVEEDAFAALAGKLEILLKSARMLVMSGTMTPNAPVAFYARCVEVAARGGVSSIVDAAGESLLRALPARPALVKPNRAELARTLGMELPDESAVKEGMRKLIDLGAKSAVVTLGAEGAIAFDGRQFWRIRLPKVMAVNTIGSGDALTAGLAAALARGQPLPDACRLGCACGAANAITLVSGEVYLEDVQAMMAQVQIS
jgi:tagatose 6-phosphate kinase